MGLTMLVPSGFANDARMQMILGHHYRISIAFNCDPYGLVARSITTIDLPKQ
jgi:hypothetical protein